MKCVKNLKYELRVVLWGHRRVLAACRPVGDGPVSSPILVFTFTT